MTKKNILLLALLTLFGFSLVGWLILRYFLSTPFIEIFDGDMATGYQVLIGSVYGLVAALFGWAIIKLPFMKQILKTYAGLIKNLRLGYGEIILISFCAGVGEEILFRGAIQPMLGVWLTSIIFVALHGYLNPANWRISIYGIFMTFIIAGLGYFTIEFGIISAMAAHMMIDVVLLYLLSYHTSVPEKNIHDLAEGIPNKPE